MIAPLYSLAAAALVVTVTEAAEQGAEAVAVEPLGDDIPATTTLYFGPGKYARLTADASTDDVELLVEAIPTALDDEDTAEVALVTGSALLGERFKKLDPERQAAEHLVAETLLGLTAPVYEGDDADRLRMAIALQLNFQLERGLVPTVKKSGGQSQPAGIAESFRDRSVNPDAMAIVMAVTGVEYPGFQPSAPTV